MTGIAWQDSPFSTRTSTLQVCVRCGGEATRFIGGRPLCGDTTCHKEQGTRNEDKEGSKGWIGVVPSPCGNSSKKKEEEPELYGLVRDYERGVLEPIDVELGHLPAVGDKAPCFDGRFAVVTEAMHTVAADIRLLLGLRLAVSEDRPLPYSTRLCAERCRLPDHRAASRVLRALERTAVVTCAGTLKRHGNPHGTKLYQAPGA